MIRIYGGQCPFIPLSGVSKLSNLSPKIPLGPLLWLVTQPGRVSAENTMPDSQKMVSHPPLWYSSMQRVLAKKGDDPLGLASSPQARLMN